MKIRIAVITDIHTADGVADSVQRGELAENLLLRAVNRFNRWIKPDIVIIAGDIVNEDSDNARQRLEKIRLLLDKLTCPYIAVRGNHDLPAEDFYKVFEKIDQFDFKGYRFVFFDDPQEPNFCASRTPEHLERFKLARNGYDGSIISVQHVPLFPPSMSDCPYNYLNAEQIIAEMKKYEVFLSISGHYHKGIPLIQSEGMNFAAAPAICELPFQYMIIDGEDEKLSAAADCFQMPPELGLTDRHVHTQLAYCSENMDVAQVLNLYKDFGLAGVIFTEHTGQLYFDSESYFSGSCFEKGLDRAKKKDNRMQGYFELMKLNDVPRASIGLEIDFDYQNRPMLADDDKKGADFFIGAVHRLAELQKESPDYKEAAQEFLYRSEAVLKSGVNVLAHPFRLFHRAGSQVPKDLSEKLVKLLKDSGVAAEMNYHTQEPDAEFFERCLNAGIKICLSSDSHNMSEFGELWSHLKLLEKIGARPSDFKHILL